MTPARSRAAATIVGLTLSGVLALTAANPARAHTTGGPSASNYRTEVSGLQPGTADVVASLGPDREQIEVGVTGNSTVIVLGYRDEPYLRIGRQGVFENRSSPAVALNRDRVPRGAAAKRSPLQPPRWVRISSSSVARWHDHRAHWMGRRTPAAVRADPDHRHRIESWQIPLRINGTQAAINGALVWIPPPSPWPWVAIAVGLAIAVGFAARTRRARAAMGGALIAAAAAGATHVWAGQPFSDASGGGAAFEVTPSLAAVALALIALVWLVRRGVWSAAPLVVLAGLFVFVSGGIADLSTLSHANVPSRLEPSAARGLVAVALGLGLGLGLSGAARLRAPQPET